jgi:hypothetical protein
MQPEVYSDPGPVASAASIQIAANACSVAREMLDFRREQRVMETLVISRRAVTVNEEQLRTGTEPQLMAELHKSASSDGCWSAPIG